MNWKQKRADESQIWTEELVLSVFTFLFTDPETGTDGSVGDASTMIEGPQP